MALGERRGGKIISFEESLRTSMGTKWKKVSEKDKEVIHQMSECQKKGGPIGSAVIGDEHE